MWLSCWCELLSPSGVRDKSVHLLWRSALVIKEFMSEFEGSGGVEGLERLYIVFLAEVQSLFEVKSVLGCVASLSSLDRRTLRRVSDGSCLIASHLISSRILSFVNDSSRFWSPLRHCKSDEHFKNDT